MPASPAKFKVLDESDAYQGLSAQEYRFVVSSFSGMSDADAYRAAYDCSGLTPSSLWQRAHEIAHKPEVQAKLKELRLKADAQATLAPSLTKAFVLNGITEIALAGDKDSTRLRAYELLGKTAGIDLFRETVIHERRERSVEDIDRELRERLKALQSTIDVTPNAPKSADQAPADRRRKPRTSST